METIWRCSVILHANTGRVIFISFFGVPASGNIETISNVTFGKRLKKQGTADMGNIALSSLPEKAKRAGWGECRPIWVFF